MAQKKLNAWTPLIPATFDEQSVAEFSTEAPLGRPGQPADHAGAYVLLASDEGAYITGQCIHINGGSRCPHNTKTTEKHGAFRSFSV